MGQRKGRGENTVKISGIWKYEKLAENHKKTVMSMRAEYDEQRRIHQEQIDHLNQYYARVIRKMKSKQKAMKKELMKERQENQRRWGWNPDRAEWWPIEGTIEQIRSKVPVPVTIIQQPEENEP